jgi:uncharacterized membrane protein (UPF0127 family)
MTFWRNSKAFALILACALPLGSCNAQAPSAPNLPGEAQYLPAKPLILHTANGNLMFQAEIALTPEQHQRGLMYRKQLLPNTGMLFVFPTVDQVSFWMENTLIPLDMLFIDADGKIVTVHENAIPLDRTAIPSGKPVKAVLEISGGESAKQGIHVGDTIDPALLKTE